MAAVSARRSLLWCPTGLLLSDQIFVLYIRNPSTVFDHCKRMILSYTVIIVPTTIQSVETVCFWCYVSFGEYWATNEWWQKLMSCLFVVTKGTPCLLFVAKGTSCLFVVTKGTSCLLVVAKGTPSLLVVTKLLLNPHLCQSPWILVTLPLNDIGWRTFWRLSLSLLTMWHCQCL